MAKVSKLVTFSLMTRVIVEEDADDDAIVFAAEQHILDKIRNNELLENIENIEDDIEMPYNPEEDK